MGVGREDTKEIGHIGGLSKKRRREEFKLSAHFGLSEF